MAAPKMSVTSTVQNLLFNKSLSTMVKGIRNHKSENGGSKAAESEYVNKCLTEIKDELKTNFPDIKAVALQKLIYLQMIGYDISWAAFHIIEVMSAAWFGHKRVGYLAASLSFTPQTDVILLTTHLFRKGFNSSQGGGPTSSAVAVEGFQYETGAAISCLANIVTPDLAQDLLSDVYGLMNSSRPYIRKKAVLVLLKIFKAWPKALRLSFDRLKEKLDDENQGVVSAAVYVICELASKNPKNYLSLAPQFFKILTTSSNNWVLIKVVKLLGSLVPLEPRLAKKLTDPLSDIISTTPAKSLLYECVNTLLCGELRSKTVVRLCLEKLRNFIEDADQNLKYLGLLGLHKLLQKQPRVVSEMKDLILDCLSDEDVTIRMRALDLITSMVSLKNLVGIISKLMIHLDASEGMGQYREHVLERILFICSQDNFAYISDFEWYVSILVDLTHVNGISRDNALKINQQLLEVVVRVPGVRSYTVKQMINILLANRLNSKPHTAAVGGANTMVVTSTTPGGPRAESNNSTTGGSTAAPQGAMCEVLHAVGFIIGEYAEYLENQDDDLYISILSHLTNADVVTDLPVNVQNVYVQNQMKVLSSALLQPFDNALVKDQLSTVKSTQPKRNTDSADDGINLMSTEGGDEITEAESAKPEPKEEEEPLPDEEEEDFDGNGLRRRKHASLKRTFAQWHTFIGKLLSILYQQLPHFTRASSVEVQERAVAYMQFVKWLIAHGEFESKIEGWKSAVPILLQPTSSEKPSAATSVAATPKTAPAAPVQAVVAKLDLLSLDPVAAANAKELSIFDVNPTSSAAPVVDLFSALSTPAPAPAAAAAVPSAASSSPLLTSTSSPASSSTPAALKEKLRALAIQLGLLYAERLNPVHPKAQRKVQVPKGLDLEAYINPGCEEMVVEQEEHSSSESDDDNPYSTKKKKKSSKPKGGLYDDDDSIGSGGFGAKQYTDKKSKKSSGKDDYSGGSFDDDYSGSSKSEDKEEARKRQEKRRQQQMNDPYYIKDTSSSSSAALINVDNIPVKRLEDDDLPNLKVESKSSLAARASKMEEEVARRPHKTFKVLKHDDMPIDSDDDEGDKKKKKDKKRSKRSKDESRSNSDTDALDMDLTTPLQADEIMPRVKSYAESSAEKAEAQRKIDEAKAKAEGRKSSSSKKKKHKKDDKDRDRSKERKSKKDKKDDKKESPAKSSASSASPNLLDLFDMSGSAAPAASTSSSSSSRKSISSSPAPSSSPSSSSSADKLREKTLYKDSSLKVKYSLQLLSGSQVAASLDFSLASDNPKKIGKLEKVVLEIKCGKYVRAFSGSNVAAIKPNEKGVAVTIRDLQAGATLTEKINIEFSGSLDRSYELSARISYTADKDGKGKEHESCDLELPLSTFLVPKKVSPSEMSNLIVSSPKPLTGLAQSQLTLKKMKVSEVIRNVAPLLNVSLVEAVNFTATYYAVMTNQSSVCVLLKAKKGDESSISVEIKSISSKISEELLAELTAKIK